MRSFRVVCLVSLAAVLLCVSSIPVYAGSSADEPRITRVFYLQGMERREAITLLRSQIQVRQIAEVTSANALVVTEVAGKIQRSESLLREHDALDRSVDPHPPLSFRREADPSSATRVFRIEGPETRNVVTVLRSIYQIRQVMEVTHNNSITATGPPDRLDAAEALLEELGLLAETEEPGAG